MSPVIAFFLGVSALALVEIVAAAVAWFVLPGPEDVLGGREGGGS